MSANEYRDRFGIRRTKPLTSTATRARFSASIATTIEAGKLEEHLAGNTDRASRAGLAGLAAKRALRAQGVDLPHGTAPTPRAVIENIVIAIEAGDLVATAVKRAGLAYSAYHANLLRFPDLKSRHVAVQPRRWQRRKALRTPDRDG